ncbi:MAG: HTH-type transcriptional repressor FabR [Bdellovibrionaceae bacterium]|nr:HTH-type transcriptional repressor FabR [Pseudobdellovibrionaceae bacterium]
MATKSEQRNQTRHQLIQAGLRLSGEKGFGALSLREVAVGAGITPAAYYKHFHDLEELGLVLLDEVGLSLRRMLREARKRVEPGPDAIRVSIDAFLKFVNENGNLFRLLLGERQGATPAFRKAIHTEMDRFVAELAADLERLQGALNQPLRDPSLTAEGIVAVVFTLGAEALDLPKHKQSGLKERMTEHVRTILRGSKAPPKKGRAK